MAQLVPLAFAFSINPSARAREPLETIARRIFHIESDFIVDLRDLLAEFESNRLLARTKQREQRLRTIARL